MKYVKISIILILLFAISTNADAQFLDRLKKKVIERTTDVVIDKTADKAAEQTNKLMENILNPNLDGLFNFGTTPVDLNDLPASYNFNYSYNTKMVNEGGEFEMEYLFSENSPYFGVKTDMAPDMLMIYDNSNNTIIIKSGDAIIARELPKIEENEDYSGEDIDLNVDYEFSELPDRNFLGYNCKGYQMENDEHVMKVYIAPDAGVSFNNFDAGKGMPNNMPSEMVEFSKRYENGLMLYMEMEDKSENQNTHLITMECTSFNKSNNTIKIR